MNKPHTHNFSDDSSCGHHHESRLILLMSSFRVLGSEWNSKLSKFSIFDSNFATISCAPVNAAWRQSTGNTIILHSRHSQDTLMQSLRTHCWVTVQLLYYLKGVEGNSQSHEFRANHVIGGDIINHVTPFLVLWILVLRKERATIPQHVALECGTINCFVSLFRLQSCCFPDGSPILRFIVALMHNPRFW